MLEEVPEGTRVTLKSETRRTGLGRFGSALSGGRARNETRKGFLDALARAATRA